jgi:hypothetical protein
VFFQDIAKCTGTACNKKDTSVNEHKRLYNTTLRHKCTGTACNKKDTSVNELVSFLLQAVPVHLCLSVVLYSLLCSVTFVSFLLQAVPKTI